jgi:hypothetical protein
LALPTRKFTHAKPAEDPDWMNFYDRGQHHADSGHALFDLAVAGHRTQSAPRFAFAITYHGTPHARSRRAMTQIKLATLLIATGDPREAAAIGQLGLAAALNLRSRRTIADLDLLNQYAERHAEITDISDRAELRPERETKPAIVATTASVVYRWGRGGCRGSADVGVGR